MRNVGRGRGGGGAHVHAGQARGRRVQCDEDHAAARWCDLARTLRRASGWGGQGWRARSRGRFLAEPATPLVLSPGTRQAEKRTLIVSIITLLVSIPALIGA